MKANIVSRPGVLLLLSLWSSPLMARDLTINNVLWDMSRKNPQCVHEIPDDGDRLAAVRAIEKSRDVLTPRQGLIDASKADDLMLKEKLKGGFVLFTTLSKDSRLFKATTRPLDIRIDNNTLRWDELTMPITEDLRIILVGKNPYGDGYCVVFAAGSNKSLVGINSIPSRGDSSYHIYKDNRLQKEGVYNEDLVIRPDHLGQAEAVEDVKQFFSTLQRVHPDLLARVQVHDYIKLKQQTLDGIAAKLDKDGKIAVHDVAYLLYYAAAFFQDGHTRIGWTFQPNELNTEGRQCPSFVLTYDNGRFVITASSNKSIEGMEVVSVNGEPVKEFLCPVLDRISGETLAFKAYGFIKRQAFWYAFSNLCGSAESLTLGLRDGKGTESEQRVATVGFADFRRLNANVRTTKLEEIRRKGTQVHFLDSDRIAYLVYPGFVFSQEEEKRIDGIFKEIKARGSEVID